MSKTTESDVSPQKQNLTSLLERLAKQSPKKHAKGSKSLESIYQKRVKKSSLHGYQGGESLKNSEILEQNRNNLHAFNRAFSKFKTDVLRGTIKPEKSAQRGPSLEKQGLKNKYGEARN